MEYSRARGSLPPELDGLLASQMMQAINEANLGLADRRISERYYIDRLPQIDIACEMGLSRKTVNRHLLQAAPKIGRAAAQFNISQ